MKKKFEVNMFLKPTLKTIYRSTARWHVSRSHMTPSEAQDILSDYSPDPGTTCVANNKLECREVCCPLPGVYAASGYEVLLPHNSSE